MPLPQAWAPISHRSLPRNSALGDMPFLECMPVNKHCFCRGADGFESPSSVAQRNPEDRQVCERSGLAQKEAHSDGAYFSFIALPHDKAYEVRSTAKLVRPTRKKLTLSHLIGHRHGTLGQLTFCLDLGYFDFPPTGDCLGLTGLTTTSRRSSSAR